MVKIELAGNQRPQEELAYRKLPSSVTRWEIFFPMYYMDHAETGWFYTHSKKAYYQRDNLACNLVRLGRKGMEMLFLFCPYQQSRKMLCPLQ